jgi:hypothetical protein
MKFTGSVEAFRVWLDLVCGFNAHWLDRPLSEWVSRPNSL